MNDKELTFTNKFGTNINFNVPPHTRDKLISIVHKLEDGLYYNSMEMFQNGMMELLNLLEVREVE